jgi:hypothetical protein
VKQQPKNLKKHEYVFFGYDFTPEIKKCEARKPRNNLTTINYIREIITYIGNKYEGDTFNPLSVNLSDFKGIECKTTGEVNVIINSLFRKVYPSMFSSYIKYHVQYRPNGTKLIYFVGPRTEIINFYRLGLEEVEDIEEFYNPKPKRIIGKPAITEKESLKLNSK